MAMAKEYTINDPEDLLECPYESAHMIRAKRMQYHLMKCREQHPCSEFVRCPYNATHEVYSVELRYHMATCEDRQRVQGKIAQERLEKDIELKGCTETPGYRPLDVWGESWEQDIPSLPLGIPPTPAARPHRQEAKREVEIPESQTEGLTGRQLRQLYLRRKAEEALRKEAQQRKEGPGEKLRVPRQPSQSLAIHQQRQQQQHEDIYQKALKGQENRAIAFGRGRGLLQGVKPAQVGATQLPTRPGAATSIPTGRGQGHVSAGAGCGAGFNSQTVGIQNIGGTHLQGGTWNSLSSQMALMTVEGREGGAGGERSVVNAEGDMSSLPSASGLKNTGLGPQGKGRASAQNFISMAGRSLGPRPPEPGQARGTVPFYQSASQPNPLYPTMQQAGAGWGRGAYPAVASVSTEHNGWDRTGMQATTASTCHEPSLYVKENSNDDDDDNEQFQDAMSWVGGGYGDDIQTTPTLTSSSTSLPANPQLVGSWAEHMEQAFPIPSASASSVSDSTSSDSEFQGSGAVMKKEDAVKELRRIRKKLRQIDNLELKMREGWRLEPAEEAKWRNKPTLIAQATSLQQTFSLK